MKKFPIIAIFFSTLIFSCKKEDTTDPIVAISGGNPLIIHLPTTAGTNVWTAPLVTAQDDEDGDVSASITASADPDVNTKGVYYVTYTATDNSGNQGSAVLTVSVENSAESTAGNYSVHDSVPTLPALDYTMNISTDNRVNNRIHFNSGIYNSSTIGFACYQNNFTIQADIVGNNIVLSSQTAGPIGTDNSTHDFVGNGMYTQTISNLVFELTYSDHDQTNSTTASGCIATYTHQ